MKSENFRCELSKIKDENIKKSTEYILNLLPDYFYTMPASTSGKYHPEFSLGEKGLVRHVKVVSRIAEELFLDSVFSSFDEHKKDLIRMSILLHDGLKKGIEEKEHTDFSHPIIMANLILENKNNLKISIEDIKCVYRLISTHMGPWNKKRDIILPVPKEKDELFVHLCDYIASRKFLNVNFENDEITDKYKEKK